MHLLTIKASPWVPEPALEESEPEEPLEPEVLWLELLEVVVVTGLGLGLGLGSAGPGPGPGLDGLFHRCGSENVVLAKKPMVTKAVTVDPRERMTGYTEF